MTSNSVIEESKLVSLASIAAVLHGVKEVAWGVSLAAKNAKVISAQAGDKGRGFQPITDFIDEISQLAMQGVNEINEEALVLLKIAVTEQRNKDAFTRFKTVSLRYTNAKNIDTIVEALNQVEQNMFESMEKFRKNKNHLMGLLQTMNEYMLSARSIASVSRIVTSDAQEYRTKLEIVADNLDAAAVYIKEKISSSYGYLNKVKTLTQESAP